MSTLLDRLIHLKKIGLVKSWRGWTLATKAAGTEISAGYVNTLVTRLKTGEVEGGDAAILSALARQIGVRSDWLISGVEPMTTGAGQQSAPSTAQSDPLRPFLARCKYEPARLAAVDFLERFGETPDNVTIAKLALRAQYKNEKPSREELVRRMRTSAKSIDLGIDYSDD